MITYSTGQIVTDLALRFISASDSYYNYVCDGQENDFLSNVFSEDVHLLEEMAEHLKTKDSGIVCFRMKKKCGEYAWVTARCTKDISSEGDSIIIDFQDISQSGGSSARIPLDEATGLLTKKAITDYAKEKCANPEGKVICLGILDVDNFKHINDTKGHAYGDKVLAAVSRVIQDAIGDFGKAGRIGGDEILLVIELDNGKDELRPILRTIREKVEKLFKDEKGFPLITVSIGAADFPTYVDNYMDLFNLADRMLYRAKNRGKNRYVMYTPEIHGIVVDGELKEEDNKAVNSTSLLDKTKLVLETIDGFFGTMGEAISEELVKIAAAYELDEVYVFYKNLDKSVYGYRRLEETEHHGKKISKIIESVSDLKYVEEEGFMNYFNSNGVFVVDTPQVQLRDTTAPKAFFEKHGIKHAFLYKMQTTDCDGYIALYNVRELSRKYPQPDITDFTYLAKMIEIALKTR